MKEEAKKLTDGYTKSMQEMWDDYVKYINSVKDICKDTPIKNNMGKNGNTLEIRPSGANHKLCDIFKEVQDWILWTGNVVDAIQNVPIQTVAILCRALGESVEYALEIIEKGVDYAINWIVEKLSNLTVNNKWVKKIIKKLKLIILYVKKSLLQGKLYMLKLSKKILTFAANNKVTEAMSGAFAAVVTFIKANEQIINIILQVIQNIFQSLIGFSLDGGLMGFFITPKSVMAGIAMPDNQLTMTPINANQDIFSNIADVLINPIEETFRNAAIGITSSKTAVATSKIISNALIISGTDDIIDIPDADFELENALDLSALKAAIVGLLSTLFTPEPLPKYERLHPGNLGFLTWLITAFEPTMKKCFGLPMYP